MATEEKIQNLIMDFKIPYTTPYICKCGSPLYTNIDEYSNSSYTRIYCKNESCLISNSQKLLEALEKLNLKCGIGESRAIDVIETFDLSEPVDIFKYSLNDLNNISIPSSINSAVFKLFIEIEKLKNDGVNLNEFISILYLPGLGGTRSKLVFGEYSDINKFFLDYKTEEELSEYVSEKINVSRYTDTVNNIVKGLIENKDKIVEKSKFFKFKQSYGDIFPITITGEILYVKDDNGNQFKPRSKFADYVSNKFKLTVKDISFNATNTKYLIMDENMQSNKKYKSAVKNGIPVITSLEFIKILEGETGQNLSLSWGD